MIPDNWHFRPLGEVATLNPRRPTGIAGLPPETQVSFVPMAAVSEVHGKIVSAQNRPLHDVSRGFTYFAEGDVIFAKITPCIENGKSAIARELASSVGFGSTEFHVIRPSAPLLAEWVHLFIRQQSFRKEAANHFRGSAGQQRVPLEIPFPVSDPRAPT
jgi:type I restriction enzyme, S subunit